ncbi:hypothetical protein Esti_006434 [Eimeria stiedai]
MLEGTHAGRVDAVGAARERAHRAGALRARLPLPPLLLLLLLLLDVSIHRIPFLSVVSRAHLTKLQLSLTMAQPPSFKRLLLCLGVVVCLLLLVSPAHTSAENAAGNNMSPDLEGALESALDVEVPPFSVTETTTGTTSTTSRGLPLSRIAMSLAVIAAIAVGVLVFLKTRKGAAETGEAGLKLALHNDDLPDDEIID